MFIFNSNRLLSAGNGCPYPNNRHPPNTPTVSVWAKPLTHPRQSNWTVTTVTVSEWVSCRSTSLVFWLYTVDLSPPHWSRVSERHRICTGQVNTQIISFHTIKCLFQWFLTWGTSTTMGMPQTYRGYSRRPCIMEHLLF
jgi:hypothetical protein